MQKGCISLFFRFYPFLRHYLPAERIGFRMSLKNRCKRNEIPNQTQVLRRTLRLLSVQFPLHLRICMKSQPSHTSLKNRYKKPQSGQFQIKTGKSRRRNPTARPFPILSLFRTNPFFRKSPAGLFPNYAVRTFPDPPSRFPNRSENTGSLFVRFHYSSSVHK